MSRQGIKVTSFSKKIDTAEPTQETKDTSQKDLIFSSEMLTFRYVMKKVIEVRNPVTPASPTSHSTYTLEHNLDYAPSFLVYVRNIGTREIKQANFDAGSSGPSLVVYSDRDRITFIVNSGEINSDTSTGTEPFDIICYVGADDLDNQDT